LVIAQKLGREAIIATNLITIGAVYKSWGQYDKAIEYYQQALAIDQKLGREAEIATTLNNIATVYADWGKYDKAFKYYEKALTSNQMLGREAGIAATLNNIGMLYQSGGLYDMANEYYERSLAIIQKLGMEARIATTLNNMGMVYADWGKYDKAIVYLQKSVELKEKLRQTAKDDVRRDYLASQIGTYQNLISAFVLNGAVPRAFEVMELSRAKLLAERLAKTDDTIKVPTVQDVQNRLRKIGKDTAVLAYGNIDWEKNIQIAVTPDKVRGLEISNASTLGPILKKYKNNGQIAVISDISRGMKRVRVKGMNPANTLKKRNSALADLVNYYRRLLLNPTLENQERVRELGRVFYQALIQPMEEMIKDKKHLIIIPDGVLGYLPFETLIDHNGRYLAERVHITYAPSFGILSILKNRNYDASRKPMLAFGGAVYDPILNNQNIIETDVQLSALTANTLTSLKQNNTRSASEALARLGYESWSNLPGTRMEVEAIKAIVKNSDTVLGKDVSEANIKEMSEKGELSKYKVLHFATHGLTVPDFPELSSLVLSQIDNEQATEDGYLTMAEIVKLKIKADFVNLSACETGLGKLYAGEGVVGLTQSFLISGANGVSASLWTVNDRSTMIFMVGVYQLVNEKGMSYPQAMTEMKRAFIKGEITSDSYNPKTGKINFSNSKPKPTKAKFQSYSNPFFWAPFVYYGRN